MGIGGSTVRIRSPWDSKGFLGGFSGGPMKTYSGDLWGDLYKDSRHLRRVLPGGTADYVLTA